jgi:pyruvate/2-oxoglutarate dehydrogenase complex dihydrolipoamide acyltransferase (E2) component
MATEVRLPQWGMGMQHATILAWNKKVGDAVEAGEPLVEVEAAKVTEVVPAPVAGTLTEIRAAEEDVVEVRAVIAIIAEAE